MEDKKNIFEILRDKFSGKKVIETQIIDVAPKASYGLFAVNFNGEKNLGEIGPIKDYKIDYTALRYRSWQAYLESEIAQTIINRFATWVIGKGLKLQAEPVAKLLEYEGIKIDREKFSEQVETRFSTFRKSKKSDYSGMANLDLIARRAFINAILGGDCLVVLRFDGNNINVQLIDGEHVKSPNYGTEDFPAVLENGNVIKNGIEMNAKGEHVRYWIQQKDYSFTSVEAKSASSGMNIAFMVYGLEYRLDNVRGLPLIAVVLETLKKLERYKEATLGSAEERQKIAYQIIHGRASDGSNPLIASMAKAYDADSNDTDLPVDVNGTQLADKVAATTNKQTFNMPIDAKLEALESKNELYFKDFYEVNIDIICAAVGGIPPNVAMSKYNDSFSASRAALKDWEHTLGVKRSDFSFQFYQPIYDFWLDVEILKNKISAPGYITARAKNEYTILDAYRTARFVGTNVPHIDPLKEVNAERAKLGLLAANIPLTTIEAATEALNGGDSYANIEQYAKELKYTKDLGIKNEETTNEVVK